MGDGLTPLNMPEAPPARHGYHYQQQQRVQNAAPALAAARPADAPRPAPVPPVEDKLRALKAYRRAKGLCFTCGERWSQDHQCKATVQLHVVQEMVEFFYAAIDNQFAPEEPVDQQAEVMLLSSETDTAEPIHAIRLLCQVQGQSVVFLVDSGSTHSFVSTELAATLPDQ